MKNEIEHIIFDLGGVLLNIDLQRIPEGFKEILSYSNEVQQRFKAEVSPAYETGKISTREFLQILGAHLKPAYDINHIVKIWNSVILDMPAERLEMIKTLGQNYQVHLLSNINELHAQCFEEKFIEWFGQHPRNYFHHFYYSHEIGLRKPDINTFKWVLEQLKTTGAQSIFIDDVLENIEGAKAAGLNAYQLLIGKEDVISLTKKLGLH